MQTETAYAYKHYLKIANPEQAYTVHKHYQKERKYSVFLLASGVITIFLGILGVLFISTNAYRHGVCWILLFSGVVIACKGFLINIKNQNSYGQLVQRLLMTREFTQRFSNLEYKRAKSILLMLATEEILLSLMFATILILMHLVQGLHFWEGIFEGTLPVITMLIIGNAYRAFMYTSYRNKVLPHNG